MLPLLNLYCWSCWTCLTCLTAWEGPLGNDIFYQIEFHPQIDCLLSFFLKVFLVLDINSGHKIPFLKSALSFPWTWILASKDLHINFWDLHYCFRHLHYCFLDLHFHFWDLHYCFQDLHFHFRDIQTRIILPLPLQLEQWQRIKSLDILWARIFLANFPPPLILNNNCFVQHFSLRPTFLDLYLVFKFFHQHFLCPIFSNDQNLFNLFFFLPTILLDP